MRATRGAALLVLGLAACRSEPGPAFDHAGAPVRAREAERAFRRWGEGRFEVLAFRAGREETRVLVDDYDLRVGLYRVPFTARVRFVRDMVVERPDEVARHVGAPGWTPEAHLDAAMLALALGARTPRAGDAEDVRAAVVFEDLEAGWRFRAFDRP